MNQKDSFKKKKPEEMTVEELEAYIEEQLKERLQHRFEELYPDKRLLAIQLNGFSHAAFFDNGNTGDEIEMVRYSAYAPEQPMSQKGKKMFEHIPHYTYQGNAIEIIYIMPEER